MAIGMNTDRLAEYNEAWVFKDAFLNSRSWISHAFNTVTGVMSWEGGGAVQATAQGWPVALNHFTNDQGQMVQQRLGVQMLRNIDGHYPAGTYTAQWRGDVDIVWGGDAVVQQTGANPDGSFYATLTVTPTSNGIYFRVDAIRSPLTDVHVWLPDYQGQSFVGQAWQPGAAFSPFHPKFLESLAPFGVFRGMQFMETNASDVVTWNDRRRVDAFRQSNVGDSFTNGMAPEFIIQLANDLQQDLWLTMPHQADESYVRGLADLVRDTLDPGLKVYVEWSNEAWNSFPGYEAHTWLIAQAALPENTGKSVYDLWAENMRADFATWSQVYAAAGRSDHLKRVVAGQGANSWIMGQLLQRMNGEFDAISCDGYVTFNQSQLTQFNAATTSDQVIDALLAQSVPNTLQALANHRDYVTSYSAQLGRDIDFVLYEAGPLLQNYQGQPYAPAFTTASSSQRLYDVYRGLLRGAEATGVDLLVAFVLTDGSPYGDNSHLRYQDTLPADAPKYRALLDAISGAIYTPEVSIAVVTGTAREQGQQAATVRLTRTGDLTTALQVSYALSGQAGAADLSGLGATLTFQANVSTVDIPLAPVDDTIPEGDETLTITISAGGGYTVLAGATTASVTIVDNDTTTIVSLGITNPGFESGLTGWTLSPATGNFSTVSSAFTDPNAPTAAHGGSSYLWGAGVSGNSGGGASPAGVVQRVSLATYTRAIDAGLAVLELSGWGAGSGTGQQSAFVQMAFYDAESGGAQVGATVSSGTATSLRSWTALAASATVPAGARSVEIRAFTQRPTGSYSNRAGVDDLAATLTFPLGANDPSPAVRGVFVRGSGWATAFLNHLDATGQGAPTSLARLGYQLGDGTSGRYQLTPLPWSNLDTLSVLFSTTVIVSATSLDIRGSAAAGAVAPPAISGFTLDDTSIAGRSLATWTFATPLNLNKYLFTLKSAAGWAADRVRTVGGISLDGEWTNPSAAGEATTSRFATGSGDGVAGGDFNIRLHVVPADCNVSGASTTADLFGVRSNLTRSTGSASGYDFRQDLNGSGTITTADVFAWNANQGKSLGQLPATDDPVAPAPPQGEPLRSEGFAMAGTVAPPAIDVAGISAVVAEARSRWERSGVVLPAEPWADLRIAVADLGTGYLGLTTADGLVRIDDDAAGFGWFVDASPRDDREFAAAADPTSLAAVPGGPAAGRMDLLTTVLHELGHYLEARGVPVSMVAPAVMSATLPVGVRRSPVGPGGVTAGVARRPEAGPPATRAAFAALGRSTTQPAAAALAGVTLDGCDRALHQDVPARVRGIFVRRAP
jgi:hypothetical protein